MFGEKIKQLRMEKGLSQYQVADSLGFSRGKYANYEQGKREPDFLNLIKIAEFFDVSIDEILGRDYRKEILDLDIERLIKVRLFLDNKEISDSELIKIVEYLRFIRSTTGNKE